MPATAALKEQIGDHPSVEVFAGLSRHKCKYLKGLGKVWGDQPADFRRALRDVIQPDENKEQVAAFVKALTHEERKAEWEAWLAP